MGIRAVGNIDADRHRMGPEIRSLRLSASLSLSPSLKGCKDLAGITPCFRIFESMHLNTGAMMPGPEWQILSYHLPGMSAFLHEVDHEDEARRCKHETARTMAATKEMRH
eukprot:jgi/Tetstr1/444549/TSEL_000279.t1